MKNSIPSILSNFFKAGILFLFLQSACTEKYDLTTSKDSDRIVIEGQVVDTNIYMCHSYIRLTKSKIGINYGVPGYSYWQDGLTCINNATVIIKDNLGNADTLKPEPEYRYYRYFNQSDETWKTDSSASIYYKRGYYILNKLNPKPNRTYYLTVLAEGKEYHANCFMPHLPALDSISFIKEDQYDGVGYIPYLYFTDPPDEKNYYLFFSISTDTYWGYTVLDDADINPATKGLDVFKGETNIYYKTPFPFKDAYDLEVMSITKESYEYYKTLGQLFVNDGGNYKPAPASPVSNIDNGALGFFRASQVRIYRSPIIEAPIKSSN
jgi:hypothetical protein